MISSFNGNVLEVEDEEAKITQTQKNAYNNVQKNELRKVHTSTIFLSPFIFIFSMLRWIFYFIWSLCQGFYANLAPIRWQKKKDLKGKLILITGAGGGIGQELAKIFAELGANLVLWDTMDLENTLLVHECLTLGAGKVATYRVDVTDRETVYKLANEVNDLHGVVDILVNNAGVLNETGFLETDDTRIDLIIDVNLKGVIWVTKAFLPAMLERKSGHLVAMSSVAGVVGSPDLVDYSASKFGVFGFMEALKNQLLKKNIYCIDFTTICPIFVQTSMIKTLSIEDCWPILCPKATAKRIVETIQLRKQVLFLPRMIYWLYAAKGLFPWNIYQSLILRRKFKYS